MLKMSKAQVEGESRDVFIETSVCVAQQLAT